jgi:hypothetical protein
VVLHVLHGILNAKLLPQVDKTQLAGDEGQH